MNNYLSGHRQMTTRLDGERIAEEWVVSELLGELLSKKPFEK